MAAAWWRRKPPSPPAIEPRELLARHAGLVRTLVARLASVQEIRPEEMSALQARVEDRLAEADFALLRDYRGKSSFVSYLMVIIQRIIGDYGAEQWDLWRARAAAAGQAAAADELLRLVFNQALRAEDALDAAAGGDPVRRAQLAALWAERPPSDRRWIADLKWLPLAEAVSIREPTPLERHLCSALAELAPEDRMALQMRFAEHASLEAIALLIRQPVEDVRRRLEGLVERVGRQLARSGVEVTDLEAVLADPRPG